MEDKKLNLRFASIDNLYLDPLNPRVGRHNMGPDVTQEKILDLVADWTLDELAYSYLENGGFWLHEALLVVEEFLYGETRLVVVEGNRRLAALKYLKDAYEGNPASSEWEKISKSDKPSPDLFTQVPYLLVGSRKEKEIQSFIGFRHVTGIKQWDADEKAYFIAKMIDEQGMTYKQVMRMIGSNTPAVRRHYIGYRVLLQIEDNVEDYDKDRAEQSFTILYQTLDTVGARTFLQIDIEADPRITKNPIPETHLQNLADFARWLYGSSKSDPIITNDRQTSKFGKVLGSNEAVDYLKRSANPDLEFAFQLAGGAEEEIVRYIQRAADNVERALSRVHFYKDSPNLQNQVQRLGIDTLALTTHFPEIKKRLFKEIN